MAFDIDAYIEGRLTVDEQANFEAELAQNPALRAELEQERELREHLAVMRVRSLVRAAIKEAPPEQPGRPGWRRWIGLIALAVVLCAGCYWLWQTTRTEPVAAPTAPKQETTTPGSSTDQPQTTRPQAQQLPDATDKKNGANRPIAAADPANYRRNPAMETFVDGGLRSAGLVFSSVKPANDAGFIPDAQGRVTIRFSGTIAGLAEAPPGTFLLAIYNNQNPNKPVLSVPLELKKDAAGKMVYDLPQRLNVPLGLYYFAVEEVESGERRYVGRIQVNETGKE